ncbi:hypothetical protein FDP41_010263 [Naegleria fowleri]|uniref:SMP-30/Gluconolactonase/LRE-like region domain-containing protein n=1 Tax=Naegleria fowleri TaxID=5763 RepID=A0A6A5CCD7_NAEFO|nr:uncharacterized protein FDP41_010263 [Naegleria fowleri]KAF0983198.1 hypothetical protein FDP41_010263 [Naegleria fowleri]
MKVLLVDLNLPSPFDNEELVDHHDELNLLKLLQYNLRKKRSLRTRGFSMNFELVYAMGDLDGLTNDEKTLTFNSDVILTYPTDIKISYTHSCIVISCYASPYGITIVDLETKKFKKQLMTDKNPSYLCVEENYDGKKDALIFVCDETKSLTKYDLNALMNPLLPDVIDAKSIKHIWKYEFIQCPQGVTARNGQIYACCSMNNMIEVLDSSTGSLLDTISLKCSPYGIDFSTRGDYLIVSTSEEEGIVILSRNETRWKRLEQKNECHFHELEAPYALVFDRIANHLIVADDRNTLSIFTLDGTLVKKFTPKNLVIDQTYGVCVNEFTGELLLCDHSKNRVLFFK